MKSLTVGEIERAVGGTLNNRDYEGLTVGGVSTDSRSVRPGELFVPVEGKIYNGHAFIADALDKGAACVLSHEAVTDSRPVITVADTGKALLELAAWHRGQYNVKVVAVTGSNGKTSTKDLIASVLSQRMNVLKTKGNLNNHVGLPQTLFELDDSHDAAVLEMGMSAAGEISVLSKAAKPDMAVITNIGFAHIGSLGSKQAILNAKCEILGGMADGGRVYLNGDDVMLRTINVQNACYFGLGDGNDYRAADIEAQGIHGVSFTMHGPDGIKLRLEVHVPGVHTVYNVLAAAAVGHEMGLSGEEIIRGVAEFKPSELRLNIKTNKDGVVVIDDVYNASPGSVMAALDVLSRAEGRKICILGDMLELGMSSLDMHHEIGRYAADLDIDLIICVGTDSMQTYEGVFSEINHGRSLSRAMYFSDKDSVTDNIGTLLQKGDTVLVKASRAMKFEEITRQLLG